MSWAKHIPEIPAPIAMTLSGFDYGILSTWNRDSVNTDFTKELIGNSVSAGVLAGPKVVRHCSTPRPVLESTKGAL